MHIYPWPLRDTTELPNESTYSCSFSFVCCSLLQIASPTLIFSSKFRCTINVDPLIQDQQIMVYGQDIWTQFL